MINTRPGWGCPVCGKIYWAMPLMEKDLYCDAEWVKVTVKYDEAGKYTDDDIWHLEETWSKENRRLNGRTIDG